MSKIANSFGFELRKILALKGWKLVTLEGEELGEDELTGVVGICQILTKHINWASLKEKKNSKPATIAQVSN